eukprot:TRINITY_DN18538_c0_g1_i1.p1 TRINITY_DN18538_c0_g1~~TRINITY_DN18538_c0_g1_i1.p1  ORF type:complete len:299 (+),score=51.68 TRINITY_DN18538_c0_g1_i1:94-897(+)
MGCAGSSRAAPDDDPREVVYDPKWDDLRARYRLSRKRGGRDSDGEPAGEGGGCTVCCTLTWHRIKASVVLATSGVRFDPKEPPPLSPSGASPDILSSRDRNKIHSWLEEVALRVPSPSSPKEGHLRHMSLGSARPRHSVHTVYSQDDDEELIRSNSLAAEGFVTSPIRLTDKRCINRLQVQLKAQQGTRSARARGAGDPVSPAAAMVGFDREPSDQDPPEQELAAAESGGTADGDSGSAVREDVPSARVLPLPLPGHPEPDPTPLVG